MPTRLLGNLPTSCCAVIEVAEPAPNLASFLPPLHPSVEFRRADVEPSGFVWFLLLVAAQPPARQWSIASDALKVISQAAGAGNLAEFRVVHGGHLLNFELNDYAASDGLMPISGRDFSGSELDGAPFQAV